MFGLTMRWSLLGAPPDVEATLRDYIRTESLSRFEGRDRLHQMVVTMAEGGFFAGTYIWTDEAARTEFVDTFAASASRVSQIIGHEPDVIEHFEVVAVAEGAAGLAPLTSLGSAYRD
ncbi:MAG: hypothetical protein M3Z02_12305 [Actinomycetota bacterium]|nr:hypothetical protein [Actinomycetota bacterium]